VKYYFIIVSFFVAQTQNAQNIEVSLGAGYAYYYGDLNIKNQKRAAFSVFGEGFDTKNFKLSFSVGTRYYFPKIFSLGINFYHMNLAGYDSDNSTIDDGGGRRIRNLSFHTTVNSGFLDLQIEPFRTPKAWGKHSILLSPYIGGGIGFFRFNPKTMYNGSEVELQPLGTEGQGLAGYAKKYRLVELVVPVNVGFKVYMPSRRVSIGLDLNYNHTFTDYIDDVSTVYPNPVDFQNAYQATSPEKYNLVVALSDRGLNPHAVGEKRGSPNYDFFMTGQIKFSYILNGAQSRYYDCYNKF
jgi:hypothetical protein